MEAADVALVEVETATNHADEDKTGKCSLNNDLAILFVCKIYWQMFFIGSLIYYFIRIQASSRTKKARQEEAKTMRSM